MRLLCHIVQIQKHAFLVEIELMSKSKKISPRKKVDLELLHHRLRQRFTRSLISVDTTNVWNYIKIRVDPDPFFTLCHISSMKKRLGQKIH